jgi:hypothetical protein
LKIRHNSNSIQLITKAQVSLNEAIKACVNSHDEQMLDDAIWKTAFHLEYLTFLLSLKRSEHADNRWKNQLIDDKHNIEMTLFRVKDLLNEALKINSLEDVYQKAWIARSLILSIQKARASY